MRYLLRHLRLALQEPLKCQGLSRAFAITLRLRRLSRSEEDYGLEDWLGERMGTEL